MKRTAYTYKLLQYYYDKSATIQHIKIWLKQKATNYKYKFYPLIVTYTNQYGLYIEKKFKSFMDLKDYLMCSGLHLPV